MGRQSPLARLGSSDPTGAAGLAVLVRLAGIAVAIPFHANLLEPVVAAEARVRGPPREPWIGSGRPAAHLLVSCGIEPKSALDSSRGCTFIVLGLQRGAELERPISRDFGALLVPLHFTAEFSEKGCAWTEETHVGAAVHVFTAGKLFAIRLPAIQVAPDPIAELTVTCAVPALGPIRSDENAIPVIVTFCGGTARRTRATTAHAYIAQAFAPALKVEITQRAVPGFAAAVAEPLARDGAFTLLPQTSNHGAALE